MGDKTKIPYVDYTYNPWLGCEPVHTGCVNCYAKWWWTRLKVPAGRRKRKAESTRQEPLAWNRKAEKEGVRRRVMCGSLMDLFEDHEDVDEWRAEVFDLIRATPNLDWIIPTKRPERVTVCWPHYEPLRFIGGGIDGDPLPHYFPNICLLASVSDQQTYYQAGPWLFRARDLVSVLGFSVEPLVGPINLWQGRVDWLVIGGESGDYARPCRMEWILNLVNQGLASGVPVYVKQLGAVAIGDNAPYREPFAHPKGGDPDEWPEDLRVREYPAGWEATS